MPFSVRVSGVSYSMNSNPEAHLPLSCLEKVGCGSMTRATGGRGILVGVIVFMVGYRFRPLALDRGKKLSR
jgi:hypothetical protein